MMKIAEPRNASRRRWSALAGACALAAGMPLAATTALAADGATVATLGKAAPSFTAKDTAGRTVSLDDYKGKTVVLEWVNPGCPYVRKHYDGQAGGLPGNLPSTQKEAMAGGVVWLAINSTNIEHGDYLESKALAKWMGSKGSAPTATLMDESGKIGRAYGARTTPHMYVIDPKGSLVYAGAIDSISSASQADIAKATNHVKAALADMRAGKAVAQAQTRAYGCSVKYGPGA